MPNKNDLSIIIKTLIEQTSKQNVIKEVDTLVTTLQNKLNNIKINIGGAGLSQLVSQLNQVTSAIQKIKMPQFNFDIPTAESKKFLTAIGSIENTLNATGRTAKSTWDEFGRVTVQVTNTTKGLVENFKYQWDAVNQSLVRVNRQQQDNMLSIDQLQAKYKGMVNTLQIGKLGQSINTSELQAFLKNLKDVKVVDGQITAELQAQFNIMKQNAQMTRDQVNSAKTLKEQIQVLKVSSSNSFKQFENSKSFGALNSSSLSQYNSIKTSISSITELTPNAIQALRLLGKQFDELKIKANQSFDLRNAEQTLNNYIVKMQGDIAKFKKQFEGQFSTLKFNTFEQKALGLQIDPNASNKTADLTAKIKALNNEFGSMKSEAYANGINAANKATMSFGQQIQLIIQKFSMWIGISTVVMGTLHRITESFDYMLEQTKLFTNLQMEMTGQNLNFSEITKAAQEYAQATGTLSSEVMRAISVFGTYTSKIDEVIHKSQAAVIMSNITGKSILEISDDLMSTAFQYKMGADQYLHIVDMYASVARNLQVDFPKAVAELGSGLKYVGAVANSANMPITNVIASLGVLQESTRRTGSQVANGMKTIISRLSRVGDEIDPESFKKVEKVVYDTTGVMLKESEDNLKPINLILSELAEKWKTLGSVQKAQLAESAAGIYQRNIFISLMENYSKIQDLETEAINSNGVALQKQDIYSKSLFASIQRLQNAFQGLYQNTLSKDFMKGTVDSTTSVISVFSELSETIGGLPALITASVLAISALSSKTRNGYYANMLGSVSFKGLSSGQQGPALPPGMSNYSVQIPILNKIISSIKQINTLGNTKINFLDSLSSFTRNISGKAINSFNSLKTSIINTVNATKSLGVIGTTGKMFTLLGNGIKGTTLALGQYITITNLAKVATIGLQTVMSMGMMVAFSLVIGQVFKLADSFIHAKEKQQELFESLKNDVSTLSSELSDSEKLIKTYNDLSQATSLTSEEKEKLADATEKLSALYPNSIEKISAEGNAISLNSEKLQEYLDLKEQELNLKRQEMSEQFYKTGDKDVNNLLINEKNIKSKMDQLAEYEKNQKRFLDSGDAKTDKTGYKKVLEDISRTKKELLELKSESTKFTDELKTKLTATLQNQDGFKDFKPQELDNFVSSLLKSQDVLEQIKKSGGIEIFVANLIDNGFASTFSNINKEFNDLSKNTNKTQQDIDDFNKNSISKLTEKLSYLGNPVAENVAKVITDKFGLSISEAKEKIFDFNGAIESIQKTTTDTSEKIELYNQLLEKAKESNNDATQEVMKHVDKNKDLYDSVEVVNGVLVLNTSKLNDLKNKTIETATATNIAEINKAKIVSTQTTSRLAQYDLEITKLTTLLEIQEAYLKISNSLYTQYSTGKIDNTELFSKLDQAKKDITDVYVASRLDSLKNMEDAEKLFEEWKKERGYSSDIKDSKEMSAMRDKIYGYVELKQAVEKSNAVLNSHNLGLKDGKESTDALTDATQAYKIAQEDLNNTIKDYNNERKKMIVGSEEYEKSLNKEIEKLKERQKLIRQQKEDIKSGKLTVTSSGSNSFIVENGKLPNPIPGKELKDSFGAPRDGGSRRHEGIDIMAERGTEIHSTTSGKVLSAGNTGVKGGWGVTISDPQGNRHYYAHMNTDPSKILGIGQEILAGQVIGYVGDSGNAKGTPHLHYGITDVNKKAINPYNLLTNDVKSKPTPQISITVNNNSDILNNKSLTNVKNPVYGDYLKNQILTAGGSEQDYLTSLAILQMEGGWFNVQQSKSDGFRFLGVNNNWKKKFSTEDEARQHEINDYINQVYFPIKSKWSGQDDWINHLGNIYAPPSENNTGQWVSNVQSIYKNLPGSNYNELLSKSNYNKIQPGQLQIQNTSSVDSQNKVNALINDINKEDEELTSKIEEAMMAIFEGRWTKFDNDIKSIQDKRNFSKEKSESILPSSEEYRNNLDTQINSMKEEQDKLHEKALKMEETMQDDFFQSNPAALKKLQELRDQLGTDWWTLQKQINETSFEKITSKIEEFNNTISDLNNNTSNLESELSMLEKGTTPYNDKLKEVIDSHEKELSAIQSKKAYIESEIMLVEKGTIAYDELKQKLQEVTSAELDSRKALYDKKKQIADDTISLIKSAYEKEKDIALEAIDEQMEAEDKRHEQVKENLDDELDQYEDSINQKLKLLDELSSTEDYDDNIKKLNKEKLEIQKQIDYLGNDDSYEAKAKREELLKELSEIDLEISKTQKDREKELLKDSLNDQLDAYEKDIKEKQDAEDDKYDAEKERLDKIKDETEKYYQDMIDNEINFSNISQELMKGNIDNTISELTRLLTFVKNNISNLGQGVGNTLASEINNSINQLTGNLGSSNTNSNSTGSGNNSNNNSSNNSSNSGNTPSPIATFSPGSYENTDGTAIMKSVTLANALGESVSWGGEGTPVIIGGKSFSYKKIEGNDSFVGIREVAEALGHDVEWNNGIIDIYHEGGIIANKPTNKIMDIVNKLFNTQSNESVVKMLKGELAIPQNNVMKNFIPNMQNFVSSFIPNITPSVATSGGNIYNLTVEIANMNANSKKEIDNVAKFLIDGVRKFGKQI